MAIAAAIDAGVLLPRAPVLKLWVVNSPTTKPPISTPS
jgi:hypothetical protein